MIYSDISNLRIQNQHILNPLSLSAKELVTSMGAMQAQDLTMAKWAIGLRVQDSTEKKIETAYNNGEIIRTHLMRPTWHFVSSDDIYWLLELTAPRIKPLLKTRNVHLELTEDIFSRCFRILERELVGGNVLTRDELVRLLAEENIKTDENRLSHLMLRAELDGLICSGPLQNNKLTYALLSDRVPVKKMLPKNEALCELAKRYFVSHGPATLQDFVWWSGLSISDAKKSLEANRSNLVAETFDSDTYWCGNSVSLPESNQSVHLLPAFDELLISYRDRKAIISDLDNKKAISNNGIFRPIVVINGKVCGIWRRISQKNQTLIDVNLFQMQNKQTVEAIESEANRYGLFINKPMQLIINNQV